MIKKGSEKMNYERLFNNFSWDEVRNYYDGDPNGVFNMATEAVDRWAEKDPDRIAIYWEDESGESDEWTYGRLQEKSNQLANALQSMGIKKGDRIAGLLEKERELIVTIIATFKIGAIYVPLFTAFGADAIMHRTTDSGVSLVVTNKEQKEKLADQEVPFDMLLIDEPNEAGQNFWEMIDTFSKEFETVATKGDDIAIIQYTSGTTGLPKGAMMKHITVFALYPYFKYALHIEEDDIFFGGADLGWSYGIGPCFLGPLCLGVKNVMYRGPFDITKTFEILGKYKVTAFAHAPTGYRALMAFGGPDAPEKFNIKVKKFSSAGEPLDGEVVEFFEKHYGRSIYDHYGTTEAGLIINNYNITDMETKPGSMGLPSPGFNIQLIDENGQAVKQGEVGQIAVDTTSEVFSFSGYWENEEATKDAMLNDFYLTGDLARQDEDHYFWFEGRADDVIVSAGYRIGPTEVEATLMQHPAVFEAAVVGKLDAEKGEIVKAFIVLGENQEPSDSLKEELSLYVRDKLSKHQYPREIEFIDQFPKTQSGKIQRYLLRERA